MEKYVFVYGTLKEGHYNHYLLQSANAKLVEKNVKIDDFQMRSFGSFPCVRSKKDSFIIGDVYEIDEAGLNLLDSLEIPYGYVREIVKAKINKETKKCYVYSILDRKVFDLLPIVNTGIWE